MDSLINRNNTVYLCNTPLSKDNQNQLKFSDKVTQMNYFLSNGVLMRTFQNVNYIREPLNGEPKSYISLELDINSLLNCNYVMYKNTNTNKYYFAFIERLEYKSPTVTYVHIKSDSFQTYQFDVNYLKSFVDRQTPFGDSYNTLSDDVAHGQLVETIKATTNFTGGYFVFCSSAISQDKTDDVPPYAFTIGEYTIPCLTLYWSADQAEEMSKVLQNIANKGRGDRILSAIYIPFITGIGLVSIGSATTDVGLITVVTSANVGSMVNNISLDISAYSGYKKGRTFPYARIVVEDLTTGATIELSPEKFDSSIIDFELRNTISESPYYKIIPKNYEGQALAMNHALVVNCNTTLPVSNNLYAKYLMQNKELNQISRNSAMLNMGAGIVASGMTSNPLGVITSLGGGYLDMASITAKENQASTLGNSVTSLKDGAQERLIFPSGIKISLYTMDNSHKTMAENFWKMLGYPVRSLEDINLTSTNNYNYIKLVTANITSNSVPNDELMNIQAMFVRGVTIWNNPSTFLQY